MKSAITIASLAVALLIGLGSAALPDESQTHRHVVVLSSEEIARLGIETAPAQSATYTPQIRGYGVVTSLSTVAQTDSDIRTAQAAVADSQAALDRMGRLFGRGDAIHAVSAQTVDTARHQAASDRAQLALADRKEIATFGANAPWRGPPRNDAILNDLAAGRTALIEATFPLGISFAPRPSLLVVTHLDAEPGQENWTAHTIWDAPADPTIPGRSFFALVDRSELAQGEHVLVFAPTGSSIRGVSIPADAVLLSEDKPWCYVLTGPHRFERILIDLKQQVVGGYFVAKGIAPNQPVVVEGTGLLLARELGAATPSED